MLPALQRSIKSRCFPQMLEGFVIVKAQLGDDAGLLGGAGLVADG